PGSEPIWLSFVDCQGNETALSECKHDGWGNDNCNHDEDIGVVCSGKVSSSSPPLVSGLGAGRCAGRVEIYYNGTWGTISDDSWDLLDATVVCCQLGCGVAVNFTGSAHYGEGAGQIWLDDVNCSRDEAALWDCPARPWGQHNCRHKEDAGVICSGL
ncbi:C163A protein, partial [Nothocercus nigrocapillus]|nr:C163A protein [Nothocercus nigrocapillus]